MPGCRERCGCWTRGRGQQNGAHKAHMQHRRCIITEEWNMWKATRRGSRMPRPAAHCSKLLAWRWLSCAASIVDAETSCAHQKNMQAVASSSECRQTSPRQTLRTVIVAASSARGSQQPSAARGGRSHGRKVVERRSGVCACSSFVKLYLEASHLRSINV